METTQQIDLNEHPWLRDAAERLESLIGQPVTAQPHGPMGAKYPGTLASWEVRDDRILAWVDTDAEGPMEAWSYDVIEAVPAGGL